MRTDGEIEERLRGLYAARAAKLELHAPHASIERNLVARAHGGAKRRAFAVGAAVALTLTTIFVIMGTTSPFRRDLPVGSPTTAASDDLVVHDGDTVSGAGWVIARKGKPVRFCDPGPVVATAFICQYGVDVTGVDLSRLGFRESSDGVVAGYARLTGVYNDGTISVQEQDAVPLRSNQKPLNLPCPTPANGWANDVQPRTTTALDAYARAHPGVVAISMLFAPSNRSRALVVMVAADPNSVRAEVNLPADEVCFARSRYTLSEINTAENQFALESPLGVRAHFRSVSSPTIDDEGAVYIEIELPLVTREVVAQVQSSPPGLVRLDPWLSPVR